MPEFQISQNGDCLDSFMKHQKFFFHDCLNKGLKQYEEMETLFFGKL